ncbi:RHOMBOID-like protein 9, chloroplastic isoform X2 [Mercurialis annua]|uniref:RHOMBOID-like protein 9, chloroplastic isoform X2 n=1 Tax=Mercurialis annua TaxID=3986 RepID=UPI00215E4AAA|nr:RHOMBOID-like protein 9, chloroplastic isoform X2 [Mercurialis annua]
MAAVPVCYKIPISRDTWKRWHVMYPAADISVKTPTRRRLNASKGATLNQGAFHFQNITEVSVLPRVYSVKGENFSMGSYASKTNTNEKQLSLLDSYFGKLQDANLKISVSSASDDQTTEKLLSVYEDSARGKEEKLKGFTRSRTKDPNTGSRRYQALHQNKETSDLYIINILISINIAVVLFELASPVRNSEFELFTLPLLYGAKINDLILVGEWWRLVTPMFLHSGVFHVALGCWSLITFGPQVCKGYGSFTFLIIYILGGISGNLTSFLHTPDPTVGGTGPIFAIIGAWLVYQMQNKDVTAKDVSESLFHKAIITTGLSFILSHFGPIDDWAHLGAILTGIIYGFFTCPTLQLDNASSRSGQDDGFALVKGYTNPCKALALFAIFILFLASLFFILEPPLDMLEPDDLAWFWKQDSIMF